MLVYFFISFSNSLVFGFKLCAYVYTGSAALLSEAVHSLADVLNQVCYHNMYNIHMMLIAIYK